MLYSFICVFLLQYFCVSVEGDCWWTGCQPNTWKDTGCAQYKRVERAKKECKDESGSPGNLYECCEKEETVAEEECYWSSCAMLNTTSCPKTMTLKSTYPCDSTTQMLECCTKLKPNVNRGSTTLFGGTFEDLVKNIFFEENDFAAQPDKLSCDMVDVEKKLVMKLNKNEAVRICDLCPKLPQKHLADLFLDREAMQTHENTHFPECFVRCNADKTCMAFSFDEEESTCYLFDSTAGEFEEDSGWKTVIMTQPTGIFNDWTYTRNTRILGSLKKTSSQLSFLHCLEDCNKEADCNFVSFDAMKSICSLFAEQDDIIYVDLIYGHYSAIRASYSLRSREKEDLFVLEGEELKVKAAAPDKDKKCAHLRDEKHGASLSQSCVVSGSAVLGCEQSTGCKRCYYPEKTNAYEQLPICPDSEIERLKSVKSLLLTNMQMCYDDESCLGVGYNSETEEVSPMKITSYINGGYTSKYMLKFPPKGKRSFLAHIDLIANAEIGAIGGGDFKEIKYETFEPCAEELTKSHYIVASYSHSSKLCRLADERVSYKSEMKGDSVVSFKKPALTSSTLRYLRGPGYKITDKSRATNACSKNCAEMCSKICSEQYSQWCVYFVVQIEMNGGKCEFFDNARDFSLAIDERSTLFSMASALDFTTKSFDKLSNFQSLDFLGCFESTNEQTQTTLAIVSNDGPEVRALRVKREDNWFVAGLKSLGNGLIDSGKKIFNGVVDTGKQFVKTVENAGKGDWDKAKESFLKIPIIDLGKNTGELVGAVFTQDWDKAKDKGMEILESDGLELATSLIPGAGKAITTGFKSVVKAGGSAIKRGVKTAVKGGKKKIDDVAKAGRNVKNKGKPKPKDKKTEKRKKDEEKAEKDRGQKCKKKKTRSNRASPPPKRFKPGDCEEEKKVICKKPKNVAYVIADTLKDCEDKKPGYTCRYECKVGYKEKHTKATCVNRKGQGHWEPFPKCELVPCSTDSKPMIVYETPQSPILGTLALGDYIVAYVSLFDATRKLPIWSVALHESSQFDSKNYNSNTDFARWGWVKYPCKELKSSQTKGSDYTGTGHIWQKGHLTPAHPFRWSDKARRITSVYTNAAPQEQYTNQGPWSSVESQVYCFSKRHRSIIATGVCPESLTDSIGSKIKVPKCFWKMLCYRDENGKEQVVGFYAANKRPLTDREKRERSAEVRTPASQIELSVKVGLPFSDIWIRSARHISTGRPVTVGSNSGVWMPVNPFHCAAAVNMPYDERESWKEAFKDTPPDKKGKKGKTRSARAAKLLDRGCHPDENMSALDAVGYFREPEEYTDDGDDDGDDEGDENGKGNGDGSVKVDVQKCGKRIVGYFTSWGTKMITGRELQRLTHVIYAFLEVFSDGHIAVGSADRKNAENADKETQKAKKRLENLMRSAQMNPHVKVMFAVGGWENSQYFSAIAASPGMRVTFISSIIRIIEEYGFDGVDVDWEYPVTGGANEGVPADKKNYVIMMKEIRNALDGLAQRVNRKEKFLLSFAGAAGQWTLDPGYDLPGLLKYADFANIMSYDFFGAWTSKWGAYTGPPSPLFFGMPVGFSGKTNADWSVKYYTCKSKMPHKINMGLPFYGRYWKNVGNPVDGKDGMWRRAAAVNGKFEGGYVPWSEIQEKYISNAAFKKEFHEKAKVPYAWNAAEKIFLGYENEQSLKEKVKYAVDKNVGGLMIWALEQDDDDLTLLDVVSQAQLCTKTNPKDVNHKCSPIDDKRWWTPEDGDDKAGLCGKSAPLYKGFYPVCDPDDPGYSCCGAAGYCGSGPKYCDCPTCKNYREDPKKILEEPIKPSIPVTWYLLNDPDGKRGRCGRKIPKINGFYPTCNPDDENAYCCSNGGYCGNTDAFCKCNGCVDFKKNKYYKFGPKKWWTLEDGKDLGGQCGPKAPKVDGIYEAECEGSSNFHCCSPEGWCGSGDKFCKCKGCKDFKGKN